MKKGTKQAVAAAVGAGVMVAAAAGVMAARRSTASKVYMLTREGDEWSIREAGGATPVSAHATKKEAMEAARTLARESAPSELIVHRVDGTVQSRHGYAAS
jgi:hypothetical protein